MSNRLYLRCSCQVILHKPDFDLINNEKARKDYSFLVSKGGQSIKIKLLKDGKSIEAESVIDGIQTDIVRILKVNDYDDLKDEEKEKLHELTNPMRDAVRQLVGLLKQQLNRYMISDDLIGNLRFEWSLVDNKWHPIPRGLKIFGDVSSFGNLNDRNAETIQRLLSENEDALISIGFLHEAINSPNRRYKWIYATIAAELAIKEIIARIEPKLQVILTTLPSPPVNRLYGAVLESVAGVKSEGLGELQRGAEIRNQLLHSPEGKVPSLDEVHEYIHFIEGRINWILNEWRKIKREKMINSQ